MAVKDEISEEIARSDDFEFFGKICHYRYYKVIKEDLVFYRREKYIEGEMTSRGFSRMFPSIYWTRNKAKFLVLYRIYLRKKEIDNF